MNLDGNIGKMIPKKMTTIGNDFSSLDGLKNALDNGGGNNPDAKTKTIPKSKTTTPKKTPEPTPKLKTILEPEIEDDKDKEKSTEEEIELLKAQFDKNNQQVLDDLLEAYEFFDENKILEEKRETIIALYDDLRENKNITQEDKKNYKNTNQELKKLILDLSDDEEFRSIGYHDILPTKKKLTSVIKLLGEMEKQISDIHKIKEKEIEKEEFVKNKEKQEIINKYFYKEGVSQIIIHGVEVGDEEDDEKNSHLKHKLDFDVSSAMKIMELGGVKFKEGAKTSWINPKEKLQYDEDGKPYFNSSTTEPVVYKIGKHKGEFVKDKNGNQKFETKYSKLYLEPGTVVLDVGGTYGVNVEKGDIIQFDHHGETNEYTTSTTKEIFGVLKNMPEFRKSVMENTKTENLKWLENYVDFVTRVDNLDYEVNPQNWDNHHNTLYAVQRYFNSPKSPQEIIMDLFKNYGNVNFNGFTQKELDYVMAVGDKFYYENDTRKERPQFKNIRPLQYKGKTEKPEFFEDDLFYQERLLRVRDFADLQKRAVNNTNIAIEYNQVEMYEKNLPEYSEKFGKVLIDEKDTNQKDVRNAFNAVGAYGNGYETYVIFNVNGNQKNSIFVSTKKDASEFVDKMRVLLKAELGDSYNDGMVVPVRNSMVIIRDQALKTLDTDRVRAIMVEALELEDEVSIMIQESNDRTNKLIEESMKLIKSINI